MWWNKEIYIKCYISKFNDSAHQCAEKNKKETLLGRILHSAAMFFAANPDFEDKIEHVTQWFVEYDDVTYNVAVREIGLDSKGEIIVKMPDEINYGFWGDTNCRIEDFRKFGITMITEQEFNSLWNSVIYDNQKHQLVKTE